MLSAVGSRRLEITLFKEIAESFGQDEQPEASEIIVWDCFDQLEKEDAVAFYADKSWHEVVAYLREQGEARYFLEEWSVLAPKALAYYLRGHLEFLNETLNAARPDEEYVFRFVGALYQVIYMHKGSPFSVHQTNLLKRLAQDIADKATDLSRFPFNGHDIAKNAAQFLAQLARHGK